MPLSKEEKEFIAKNADKMSVRKISAQLNLSKADVRSAIKELEREGFQVKIENRQLPSDDESTISKLDFYIAAALGLFTFVVYLLTTAPDITGEDSGELVTASYTLGVAHPPGYPLWCILGKIFATIIPFGSIGFRVNLISAFFAAGTVFFLFLVIKKLTGKSIIAGIAALVFAFSIEFWAQSVISEVYTLNTFLLCAGVYFLLHWKQTKLVKHFYILALISGLALTNHHTSIAFAGLILPYAILCSSRRVLPIKKIILGFLIFLAPLTLYFYLPVRASVNPYMNWGNPATISGMVDHITRKQYIESKNPVEKQREPEQGIPRFSAQLEVYGSTIIKQFGWFLIWIPIIGLILHIKERRFEGLTFLLFFLITSIGLILFMDFKLEKEQIQAHEILFIPSYLIVTIWLGLGLFALWKLVISIIKLKPVIYAAICIAIILPAYNLYANYSKNDKSKYYYAYDFAEAMLDTMDNGAIIFPSGDHATFPLIYFHEVLGQRRDITIANKYGNIEESLYADMPKDNSSKTAKRPTEAEIERHIIIKYQDKPIYFTIKRDMTDLQGFSQIPEGLLFRIIPNIYLHKYKKKISEKFWASYQFRYFEDPSVPVDYSAEVIISDVRYARARCYFEEGKVKEGLDEVEKIKMVAEGYKETFNNMGNMLAERGLFKQALGLYEKALSYNPNYLKAIQNIAKVYGQLEDYDNSLVYLNRALELDQYNYNTHVEIAEIYAGKKEFDKAISKLEEIIAKFPKQYQPYNMLGFIYLNEKKDEKKAFALFRKSLELNKDQPYIKGLLNRGNKDKKEPEMPKDIPKAEDKNDKVIPDSGIPEIPKPGPPVVPKPGPNVPNIPKPIMPNPNPRGGR
jgi:tetratricopeptide (TPR) repeat protein/biotin operon repressor